MKNFIKKAILSILYRLSLKTKDQKFWETINSITLSNMNYGNGGDLENGGEIFAMKHVAAALKKEPSITIFDVGANIGQYCNELSKVFNTNAHIHSFEPSVITYNDFLKNTKHVHNLISNNLGLSDVENTQLLYSNSDGSGMASVYHRKLDHFGIAFDNTEEIKLSTVDTYCEKNNIDRIHFLKLDIEGHELKALKGAKKMIDNKKINFIQFEFGGCNIDSRTYFQDFFYLLKDNYTIYRVLKNGLFEMPVYKETYEIFITINFLAVAK